MMMHSVADVQGLNSITEQILGNGAHALAGMIARLPTPPSARRSALAAKPALGITMFGVTTPCVQAVTAELEADYDCLVFHATGIGGRSMESLAEFRPARRRPRPHHDRGRRPPRRRRLPGDRGSLRRLHPHRPPLCRLARRARHGQFRAARHGAGEFRGRNLVVHNPNVTLMRTTRDENRAIGDLDRRAAQPHERAGALPDPGGRRLGARRAGQAVP